MVIRQNTSKTANDVNMCENSIIPHGFHWAQIIIFCLILLIKEKNWLHSKKM